MTEHLTPPTFDPADAAAAAARFSATAHADVSYALIDSPVGTLVAATTDRGLACLSYSDHEGGIDAVLDHISAKISPRVLEAPARLDLVRRELDEYFEHRRTAFDLDIDWSLVSPFGRRVLAATREIPFGEVSTYAHVAAEAGNAKASRAAGNALGHGRRAPQGGAAATRGRAARVSAPSCADPYSPGRGNCDASIRSHMPSVINARCPTSRRADGVTR